MEPQKRESPNDGGGGAKAPPRGPAYNDLMEMCTDVTVRVIDLWAAQPQGQELFAALLRHRGWICTPPPAARITKPARKAGGK